MSIKYKIAQFVERMIHPNRYTSEAYVNYLRRNGAKIGKNTFFFAPKSTVIDDRRLTYIKIGQNCAITSGVQILCHDYSWSVLRASHDVILPDPGRPVVVGDNVFIGWNSIIMPGTTIGSNVIIGAHSVVTKDVPDNVVCAGNPAKVIMTLDEYYNKKYENRVRDAVQRANHIYSTTGKDPTIEQMGWFGVLYLDRDSNNEAFLRTLPFRNNDIEQVLQTFRNTDKVFDTFEDFLQEARKCRE